MTRYIPVKFSFLLFGVLAILLLREDGSVSNVHGKTRHAIPSSLKYKGNEIPCPVCGAKGQQTVLDLGIQPLANDFRRDVNESVSLPRFPLKLVRCRVCNHYHLSHSVDRGGLFEHYLYQSGTSTTLSHYFEWLAAKVVRESKLKMGEVGSILELACNDGSQLDHFVKHGWKTYGVDPAANLIDIAKKKGHAVQTGFWPLHFPDLPMGDALTAITAQNVLAHVPDVVAFLNGCVSVMGPKTILYVQTSQCNMQQLGQFDTVYHEHVSFFTGHSFLKASELAGLEIISFETTAIHGVSCLVTMKLRSGQMEAKKISPTLQARLELEKKDGVTGEFLAKKFEARAKGARNWIMSELTGFKLKGFHVGGYGAAAKGIVFLNFMVNGKSDGKELLDFVIDDAPLKQHKFCPGTAVPVLKNDSLRQLDSGKSLLLIVFAWNFLDEITQRVSRTLDGLRDEIYFLAPFPSPKLFLMDLSKPGELRTVASMPSLS